MAQHRNIFGVLAIAKPQKVDSRGTYSNCDCFHIGEMLLYNSDSNENLFVSDELTMLIHGDYYLTESGKGPDIHLQQPELFTQFDNGMFVGIIYNNLVDEYFVFNSFVNHLPLYYTIQNSTLCFSTDLKLVVDWRGGFESDKLSIMEYIEFGTILTDHTICAGVKCLSKASCIRIFSGKVEISQYYTMPGPVTNRNTDWIDEFDAVLRQNISSIKHKDRIGLGLTGGVDSRVILAGLINQRVDFKCFTGSGPHDPDCLIANKICKNIGVDHLIEDYTRYSALEFADSYIEHILSHSNPLNLSTFSTKFQYTWKQENNIDTCLSGAAGEIIGGDNYYYSRTTTMGIAKMILPYRPTQFDRLAQNRIYQLIGLGCRGETFLHTASISPILGSLKVDYTARMFNFTYDYLLPHLGCFQDEQTFLERFRALFKHSNLLAYSMLGIRDYCEWVSPYNSISMMDLAFRIPLHQKNDRKIMLRFLKNQYPPINNTVLVGSVFTPKSNHALFKMTKPLIKGLNHYNVKIPGLQTYLKPHYDPFSVFSTPPVQAFIRDYSTKASVYTNTLNPKLLYRYFALALTEQYLSQGYESYRDDLQDVWSAFRQGAGSK